MPGHGFDAPLPTGYLQPGQPGLSTEKSALAAMTMDDGAEAVLGALRQARRHRRVVLVAHSAGGGLVAPQVLSLIQVATPAARPRPVRRHQGRSVTGRAADRRPGPQRRSARSRLAAR